MFAQLPYREGLCIILFINHCLLNSITVCVKPVCVCVKVNSLGFSSPGLQRLSWKMDARHGTPARHGESQQPASGCDFVHFHEDYPTRVCECRWRTMQRETERIALCQWKTTSTSKKTSSPRTLSGSRASSSPSTISIALSCWDSCVGAFHLDSRDNTLQHRAQLTSDVRDFFLSQTSCYRAIGHHHFMSTVYIACVASRCLTSVPTDSTFK